MTTPWRSVQDAEKANETVAWQALPCRLSGGRVSKHRKLPLAHVIQLFAAKWRKMRIGRIGTRLAHWDRQSAGCFVTLGAVVDLAWDDNSRISIGPFRRSSVG
jgi:hypothetical protein